MQQPRTPSSSLPSRRNPISDALVVVSMTVVALALGIGLHLQFALDLWLAVLAAAAFYVALLSTHIVLRRSEHTDDLLREVSRLEAKLGEAQPGPALATADGATTAAETVAAAPASVPAASAGAAPDYWSVAPAAVATVPERLAASNTAYPIAAVATRTPAASSQPTDHYRAVTWPTSALPPGQPQALARDAGADAAQIDAVIKKLAADITQGQADMAQTAAAAAAAFAPADIEASIAALQAAADAMREPADAGADEPDLRNALPVAREQTYPRLEPPAHGPALAVADAAYHRLAAVAEAIERERFDVMLEPILGLDDRRAQHYVVTVRLRDLASGVTAEAHAGPMARGSGLLPLLDAVKVERAARVAWRMEDRGKPGSLFSQVCGESLVNDRFLNRFADTYRQGDTLGSRLVLSFRQDEVRTFSALQWATLRDMADLGFRFSIEDITDLDFDFETLSAAGFTFAKLDAEVFFDGLPAIGGIIPATDICRHFARLDLLVIVDGIADEDVSLQLQALGVELGSGRLFGEPRAVKADVLRSPQRAVA